MNGGQAVDYYVQQIGRILIHLPQQNKPEMKIFLSPQSIAILIYCFIAYLLNQGKAKYTNIQGQYTGILKIFQIFHFKVSGKRFPLATLLDAIFDPDPTFIRPL